MVIYTPFFAENRIEYLVKSTCGIPWLGSSVLYGERGMENEGDVEQVGVYDRWT